MDNTKNPAVRLDPGQLEAITRRADAARRVGGAVPHKIPQTVKGADAAAATKAQQQPGVITGALKAGFAVARHSVESQNALTRALDKAEQDSRY